MGFAGDRGPQAVRPGKQEPSLSMLRQMAHAAGPESVLKYLVSARRERDGLREALAMKLSGLVTNVGPEKHDTLVLRWPGAPRPEVMEALDDLRTRLRQRMGWEGELLVLTQGASAQALALGEQDTLVLRYKDRVPPDQIGVLEDVVERLRAGGWAGQAMVLAGDVVVEVRPGDSAEKTAELSDAPGQDSTQSE